MITFYVRDVGYTHKTAGKPCQDDGLTHKENGVYMAIACDGHGSKTYVRSHDGAKFAAEIAKEKTLSFIKGIPPDFFIGKKGAVTARPTRNLLEDKNGNPVEFSSLSESKQETVLQDKSFIEESAKHPEIEERFRNLFKQILNSWNERIEKDLEERPLNEEEKEKLGDNRIAKAYGTTLMVAVCTPYYWFAFHLGDGKILTCDKLINWTEPVPWDCNCFLNYTTSLCNSDPVSAFRYAFDGTGNFPIAFIFGSDGIDDTYFEDELLHKFYSKVLMAFNENTEDEAVELLKRTLPVLSEKGSHDDMSLAGIIDENEIKKPLEYYGIISEGRSIVKERGAKEEEIRKLERELDKKKEEFEVWKSEMGVRISELRERKEEYENSLQSEPQTAPMSEEGSVDQSPEESVPNISVGIASAPEPQPSSVEEIGTTVPV
ncbi:MAG: protein phosphatase 2C domain-containing protein [Bacteroidales bacterium]|nr:protein phosphatase 2C domain-containing protein [Bacteroidales bacterium]